MLDLKNQANFAIFNVTETVGIQWPSVGETKLAAKDAAGKALDEADAFN